MTELLIGDLIRRNAAVAPERVAAWMEGAALTYRELDEAGNRVAWALHELGIRHGDRVVSWADTSLDVLPLFVALAKLGAVFAPLNARFGVDEAVPVVRMARPRLLVTDAAHSAAAERVVKAAEVSLFATLGSKADSRFDLQLDPDRLPRRVDDFREPSLREADPHVIFFTSGSTGLPKGVILSHRANYLRTFQGVFLDEPERSVCMFPLFHMAAFTLALAAWQTQGEIAFVPVASADAILEAVEQRRANRLYCIPAVWSRILETDPARFDTSQLRYIDTGTSATPIELLQALKRRFPNSRLRVYYGSTEAGAGTALLDSEVLAKPGSVGRPTPGVDLRLSESGEICLRTHYMMDGYFDNPKASSEALHDGWYHTGDLGCLDEEGCLSVVGRIKEIIRTGGEAVAPAEVEAALASLPGVAEVAVVGIPDAEWGEVVCAAVVSEPGRTPTFAELQEHCAEKLAGFKKPRRLELFEALPRTAATAQVQRLLLVEQILARQAAGRGNA
jgi:acyl-CoA synthetase (AMP-forming)/AMP-acid ligase II